MSPELGILLRALLADPSKLAAVTPDQERRLMADLEALVGQDRSVPPVPALAAPAPAWSEADLLTAEQVAGMLKTSVRFVYRNAGRWPFTRRISRKCLRFDRPGLLRFLAKKGLSA
jgi:hypothetical protein